MFDKNNKWSEAVIKSNKYENEYRINQKLLLVMTRIYVRNLDLKTIAIYYYYY